MIRTPLRPLATIIKARAQGENPDAIEKENIRKRHEEMRDKARVRAEGRLLVLGTRQLELVSNGAIWSDNGFKGGRALNPRIICGLISCHHLKS